MKHNRERKGYFIVFYIILALFQQLCGYGQSLCPDKGIQTNPDDAVNNERPSKRNSNPLIFDWRQEYFPILSTKTTSTSIISPYYNVNNVRLAHLVESKDYRPEDGWELIRQELGHPIDPVGSFTVETDYPFVILYNRYTAVLRVFVAVFATGYNNAHISLEFEKQGADGFPSTLDIANSTQLKPLRPLDDFSDALAATSPKFSTVVGFVNTDRLWMYADYPMIYDPCICLYKSNLVVKVYLTDEAKISLSGTTSGQIVSIDQNNNITPTNRLMSLGLQDGINAVKKGAEIFNDMNQFKSATLAKVDTYHGIGPYLNQEMVDRIQRQKEILPPSLNWLEKTVRNYDFARNLLVASPALRVAGELFSYLLLGGKDIPPGPQQVEVMPMSIETTSSFNGTVINTQEYRNIRLRNPGSLLPVPDNAPDLYPYYNEPLGLFNLLVTPEADFYQGFADEEIDNWGRNPRDTFKIKLRNNTLEYVINEAAGINRDDVELLGSIYAEFNTPYVANMGRIIFDESNELISDKAIRTRYVPLGCLSDLPLYFWRDYTWVNGTAYGYMGNTPWPKLFLKVIARFKRTNSSPTVQNIFYTGKFPIKVNEIEMQPPSYWQSNWQGFSNKLTLENVVITSSKKSWEVIEIGQNVTFQQGQTVELVTGNEIIVGNETIIPDNTTLRIGLPVECSNVIAPATQSRVSQFCTSNSYTNNRSFTKEGSVEDQIDVNDNILKRNNTVLYDAKPNPFNMSTMIPYYVSEKGSVRLRVTDSYGREVATLVDDNNHPSGMYQKQLLSENLPAGVYNYTLQTSSITLTKKVVLVK